LYVQGIAATLLYGFRVGFLLAFSPPSQGIAATLLYGNSLNCTDNLNNGMKRVIRALQQSALVTFFGNIAFDNNGMNYNAIAAVVQVGNMAGVIRTANGGRQAT
jgi:hypothetical protein